MRPKGVTPNEVQHRANKCPPFNEINGENAYDKGLDILAVQELPIQAKEAEGEWGDTIFSAPGILP